MTCHAQIPLLPFAFILAMSLDWACGDPRWHLHPVRLMGGMALRIEPLARRMFADQRLGGVMTGAFVITLFTVMAGVLTLACALLHPALTTIAASVFLYFTIAPHDLALHARAVARALGANNLPAAHQAIGMIVGRDTQPLDEQGVARAAIESIAENLVDGVVSAMLWALGGGFVGLAVTKMLLPGQGCLVAFAPGMSMGAFALRAINTMDATFGYKNEKYIHFGWFSARVDDAANFLPARLCLPFAFGAALVLRQLPVHGLRMCLRDHARHSSPNSAWPESFFAGALGVQLAGPVTYKGHIQDYPYLGDALEAPVSAAHIQRAIPLMLTTSWLVACACTLTTAIALLIT